MIIQKYVSLKPYNTFGIDVVARNFVSVNTTEDLAKICSLNQYPKQLVLGGGSNILLTKDVKDLVVHINIKGLKIISETKNKVLVKVNAGENWHQFVLWCVTRNYGGVENLSLIPGNVGTAPVQNIGAYGVALKDIFYACEALEIATGKMKIFTPNECNFKYRNSIFKDELKGKFIITSVTFNLSKINHKLHTDYGDIQLQLSDEGIVAPTIKDLSNAIIAIRERKLPNPKQIGNAGSFFKNPIVNLSLYKKIQQNFADVPNYNENNDLVKIPAGWLIEKSGFKGKSFGNYGVHKNQALVLVNHGGASGNAILKLAQLIQNTVYRLFHIELEPEVNII